VKYALLVYADQSDWENLTEQEAAKSRAESIGGWYALFDELRRADANVTGHELEAATAAKVVRLRDGERIVTDGPFAETKELIGGLFMTELPDLDEAIRLAALIPAAEHGSIEIRPVVERAGPSEDRRQEAEAAGDAKEGAA
jgi:hypothetical protein